MCVCVCVCVWPSSGRPLLSSFGNPVRQRDDLCSYHQSPVCLSYRERGGRKGEEETALLCGTMSLVKQLMVSVTDSVHLKKQKTSVSSSLLTATVAVLHVRGEEQEQRRNKEKQMMGGGLFKVCETPGLG